MKSMHAHLELGILISEGSIPARPHKKEINYEEARKCFESYDADGKGTIDFAELFAVCHWGCLHVGVMYV